MTEYAPDTYPLPIFASKDFKFTIKNPEELKREVANEVHDTVLIQEQMDRNKNPGTLRELFFASSSRSDAEWTQHTVYFANAFEHTADVPQGDRTRLINMMVTQLTKSYDDTQLGYIYGDKPGELIGFKAPIVKGTVADIYLDMHHELPTQWVWRTEVTKSADENVADEKLLFVHNSLVLFARMSNFTANVEHDENTVSTPYEVIVSKKPDWHVDDMNVRFISLIENEFMKYDELASSDVPKFEYDFVDFEKLASRYSCLSDEQICTAVQNCIFLKRNMYKRLGVVSDVTGHDIEMSLLRVKSGVTL